MLRKGFQREIPLEGGVLELLATLERQASSLLLNAFLVRFVAEQNEQTNTNLTNQNQVIRLYGASHLSLLFVKSSTKTFLRAFSLTNLSSSPIPQRLQKL